MAKILNIPNTITFFRFFLIIPLILYFMKDKTLYVVSLFLIFLLLDGIDGRIARKLNQVTKFGRNFDYLVDVLFGSVLVLYPIFTNKIPTLIWILTLLNFLIFGIFIILSFRKKKVIYIYSKKYFGGLIYFSFIFLLVFSIYNKFTITLSYILLALMYYICFDYFFEIKNQKLLY